jgi:hypothetical protein
VDMGLALALTVDMVLANHGHIGSDLGLLTVE